MYIPLIITFYIFYEFNKNGTIDYIDEYINFIKLLESGNEGINSEDEIIQHNMIITNNYAIKNQLFGLISVVNHLLTLKNNRSARFVKLSNKKDNTNTFSKLFSEKSTLG